MKQQERFLWRFAAAVALLAILSSLWIASLRIGVEQTYNQVNISVSDVDIATFANASGVSLTDMATTLQDHGVSQVLCKEVSIGDLLRQGRLKLVSAFALTQLPEYGQINPIVPIQEGNLYLCLLDDQWEGQVVAHLMRKTTGAIYYPGEVGIITIPGMIPGSAYEQVMAESPVLDLGVGFDQGTISALAKADLGIILQLRSWPQVSDKALYEMVKEIKATPNLAFVLFNDKEVPGYPDQLRNLALWLADDTGHATIPIGQIEFNEQKGLSGLGVLLEKNVIRLHTISNAEMSKFRTEAEAMHKALDRWKLAARERNMRALLVRFVDINTPATSLENNLHYLSDLTDALTTAGLQVTGEVQKMPSVQAPEYAVLLAGLGVSAGLMLLLLVLRMPRLSILAFIASALGWVGLYMIAPELARKLMALLGVIIYPSLSGILFMRGGPRKLLPAIGRLLAMSAVSFIGAILLTGLLSETLYMLKLDQFVGVKLAHIVPILFVPLVIYIWQAPGPMAEVKRLANMAVTYRWGLLAVVLGVAGIIYITRTGNTGAELSAPEELMRQGLTDLLGVRPRSKEFLIGYPLTLLFFYYGANRRSLWMLMIGAIIGQVSLVNTYAHIHTPLLISLERSANGLLFGIILGVLLILGSKLVLRLLPALEQCSGHCPDLFKED